ncbi:MAG: MBL fold metallo-hydrolase [Mogibacterium sp.]|nr:MBL fold metallo-hydrolase [Mogibacterium sp.]
MPLKIISIGSSSSGNSYLITSGRTNLLLDVGLTGRVIKSALAGFGLCAKDINGLFVTHEHIDHIRSLRMMARECADAQIVTSRGTRNACPAFEFIAPDRLKLVQSQSELVIGDIYARAFSLSHDAAEPVGFSFSSGGESLTVVTDTGVVTDEIFYEIAGADKLVLEANHEVSVLEVGPYPYMLKRRILSDVGHLSNEAAGNALARAVDLRVDKVKAGQDPIHVMLAHLSTTNNTPDNARLTVKDVLREHGFAAGNDYLLNIAAKSDITPMDAPVYGADDVVE